MERTLESVLSPSDQKSMSSTVKRLDDDRPLTGTGKYSIKVQPPSTTDDDDEYSDNYSDDFEDASDEEDESATMGSTG